MPNIGMPELFVVLLVALVVFGPKRLPEMGRQLGKSIREFRKATGELRSELGIDDAIRDVGEIKSQLSLTVDDDTEGGGGAAETEAPGTPAD
jgi:sec-independent protein translocase protein TatA